MTTLRDPVHRLVPAQVNDASGGVGGRGLNREVFWAFMLANCVGRERRMIASRIGAAIGLRGNFKTQGSAARRLALENIRLGRPVCGTTGNKKTAGLWIPTTREDIDLCADYIERMAQGLWNSAAALRACNPFGLDS